MVAAAEKFREGGMISLSGVEVFAVGTQRGKPYPVEDLDEMVENFNKFSAGQKPLLRVPAVLGHEETQELLERSDLPAAAWAKRLYREGRTLKADFQDVAPAVAQLLKNKSYRTVSAEIYDDPPEGVPGKGKMLRRVAFLGGEIPQLKNLSDIPAPVYREAGAPFLRLVKFREQRPAPKRKTVFVFSEVQPMSREEMLAELGKRGFDTAPITDTVPDQVIAEMLRCMTGDSSRDNAEGDEPIKPDDPTKSAEGDEIKPAATPEEKAKFRGLSEKYKKLAEKYAGACGMSKHDDPDNGSPDPMVTSNDDEPGGESGNNPLGQFDDPPAAAAPAGSPDGTKHPTSVMMKYSESQLDALIEKKVTARIGQVKGIAEQVKSLAVLSAKRVAEEKRGTIKAFCERMLQAGKLLPAEIDAGLQETLMALDATKVQKFGEKTGTQLDLMLRSIEARPMLVTFAERFKDPADRAGAKNAEEEECRKVEIHFEKFKESFPKGYKREALVSGFKAARKNNEELTAEAFLR